MNWPSEPVLLEGLSAAEYHADLLGDVPTLSRSIAHTLITASPKHAAAEHPRLIGTAVRKQSKAMDLGSLVHCLLLGGEEALEVLPPQFGDFKTGAARTIRDDAYEAGKTPVLFESFELARLSCEILKPEICRAIFQVLHETTPYPAWEDFGREITCLWEEEALGPWSAEFPDDEPDHVGIRCRARFDLYLPSAALIADVKVVTGGAYAKAGPFIRQLNSEEDSGAMQSGSYCRGLSAVHPEVAGRETFVFLRVEPVAPYSVVPIVVTQGLRRLGEQRWERAVAGWAGCMAANVWPGPSVAYAQVESWSLQRELDRTPQQEGGGDGPEV